MPGADKCQRKVAIWNRVLGDGGPIESVLEIGHCAAPSACSTLEAATLMTPQPFRSSLNESFSAQLSEFSGLRQNYNEARPRRGHGFSRELLPLVRQNRLQFEIVTPWR